MVECNLNEDKCRQLTLWKAIKSLFIIQIERRQKRFKHFYELKDAFYEKLIKLPSELTPGKMDDLSEALIQFVDEFVKINDLDSERFYKEIYERISENIKKSLQDQSEGN